MFINSFSLAIENSTEEVTEPGQIVFLRGNKLFYYRNNFYTIKEKAMQA